MERLFFDSVKLRRTRGKRTIRSAWLPEAISHFNARMPASLEMRRVPFISLITGLMFCKHINGHLTSKFSTWGGSSGVSRVFRYSENVTFPS
eukprot:364844-Chlamydomonas_euryale.AAC.8